MAPTMRAISSAQPRMLRDAGQPERELYQYKIIGRDVPAFENARVIGTGHLELHGVGTIVEVLQGGNVCRVRWDKEKSSCRPPQTYSTGNACYNLAFAPSEREQELLSNVYLEQIRSRFNVLPKHECPTSAKSDPGTYEVTRNQPQWSRLNRKLGDASHQGLVNMTLARIFDTFAHGMKRKIFPMYDLRNLEIKKAYNTINLDELLEALGYLNQSFDHPFMPQIISKSDICVQFNTEARISKYPGELNYDQFFRCLEKLMMLVGMSLRRLCYHIARVEDFALKFSGRKPSTKSCDRIPHHNNEFSGTNRRRRSADKPAFVPSSCTAVAASVTITKSFLFESCSHSCLKQGPPCCVTKQKQNEGYTTFVQRLRESQMKMREKSKNVAAWSRLFVVDEFGNAWYKGSPKILKIYANSADNLLMRLESKARALFEIPPEQTLKLKINLVSQHDMDNGVDAQWISLEPSSLKQSNPPIRHRNDVGIQLKILSEEYIIRARNRAKLLWAKVRKNVKTMHLIKRSQCLSGFAAVINQSMLMSLTTGGNSWIIGYDERTKLKGLLDNYCKQLEKRGLISNSSGRKVFYPEGYCTDNLLTLLERAVKPSDIVFGRLTGVGQQVIKFSTSSILSKTQDTVGKLTFVGSEILRDEVARSMRGEIAVLPMKTEGEWSADTFLRNTELAVSVDIKALVFIVEGNVDVLIKSLASRVDNQSPGIPVIFISLESGHVLLGQGFTRREVSIRFGEYSPNRRMSTFLIDEITKVQRSHRRKSY